MSFETEERDDTLEIEIRRPLDIGYEFLPDGVSALDFIYYDLIPLPKPKLYRKDELPSHELMGDEAVIRRELLEEEPVEHSELWLKIVSKLNPELLPTGKEKTNEEQEFLQCHLVDRPTSPRLLQSLMPRKTIAEDMEEEIGEETGREETDRKQRARKEPPMLDMEAMEKLKQTVNWLKHFEKEESMNEM